MKKRKQYSTKKRRNPRPPYFSRDIPNSNIETLNYITKYYHNEIKEDQFLNDLIHLIYNNNWTIKYISSSGADVFYVFINKTIKLGSTKIYHGRYALKIKKGIKIVESYCADLLIKMSKLGLIPKIYIISKSFILMDFLDGIKLSEISDETRDMDEAIYRELLEYLHGQKRKLIKYINKLGITSDFLDIHDGNFIVSRDFKKVWYIDPC